MSYPFLNQLLQTGHLQVSATAGYRDRELRSLQQLLRNPARSYLQEYDLLFRYVSLWLLQNGYELTNRQPHQVLARVCEQYATRAQVQEIVRCRHAWKYDGIAACSSAGANLSALIEAVRAVMPPHILRGAAA